MAVIRGKARRKEQRTRRTKRFRAANPPHDHDDKTKYHDDDLIKYQRKEYEYHAPDVEVVVQSLCGRE